MTSLNKSSVIATTLQLVAIVSATKAVALLAASSTAMSHTTATSFTFASLFAAALFSLG
jgi:hypothetical protein